MDTVLGVEYNGGGKKQQTIWKTASTAPQQQQQQPCVEAAAAAAAAGAAAAEMMREPNSGRLDLFGYRRTRFMMNCRCVGCWLCPWNSSTQHVARSTPSLATWLASTVVVLATTT